MIKKPLTQQDLISNMLEKEKSLSRTERFPVPNLADKTKEEIAMVLTNLLKSRSKVIRIDYSVANQYVELTTLE